MAETIVRGPNVALGPLMGSPVALEPWDGTSLSYQSYGLLDPRFAPASKDGMGVGRMPGMLAGGRLMLVDAIPSTLGAAAIAAAAAPVAATAMTLVTVAPGGGAAGVPSIATGVPFNPMTANTQNAFPNQGTLVSVMALDFGFTTGNLTAGAAAIVVPDSTRFFLGQWVVIGGAGNSAKTKSLITQVIALTDATHISVSPAPLGTLNNAPIGNANFNGPFPQGAVPTGASPYWPSGLGALLNPEEAVCRAVSVTGNAGSSANNVTINGYDIYGQAMSEVIAFAGGAVTTNGKKAFKYIVSATPDTSDAGHTISIGTTDIYGFALRSDAFEEMDLRWNSAVVTANTGYVAGTTAALGDVRGTYALQAAANNALRLVMSINVSPRKMALATAINPASLYGPVQT